MQDAKIEPERQPFALATETEDLRARLALVERFINKLPDPLKTTFKELGISEMGQVPRGDFDGKNVRAVALTPLRPPSPVRIIDT